MTDITDAKILIMASDGFEQSELMTPLNKLKEAGATVHVASPDGASIRGWDKTGWGETVGADMGIGDTSEDDYHALVLPGGQINPDVLRTIPEAVLRVQEFVRAGKPVAAICHAPWLLIEADVVRGKRLTSYNSMRTDLKNAGAEVVDQEVAQDGNLITSRNPGDLDAFCKAIVAAVEGRDPVASAA